jgi:ribose transport system ATP-binding protein
LGRAGLVANLGADEPKLAASMNAITKAFGSVRVLDHVSFELHQGEIHALLGGNGAGKSTLMKILTGVYTPDEGTIEIEGRSVHFGSSRDAKAAGIAMIFQELSLVPSLTVSQNVCLNREPRTALGLIDDRRCIRIAGDTLSQMQVDIDPRSVVARLGTSQRQLVEIAKALSQGARIIIMDEPTASLASNEVRALFEICRRLKQQGIAIVYVSHRMEEVFELSDRLTVLRDGRSVLTATTSEVNLDQVVDKMVGTRQKHDFAWLQHNVDRTREPLLSVRGLTTSRLHDVSFDLYAGEVLGVVGLMGSGRSSLLKAVFGIERTRGGEMRVRGKRVTFRWPRDAIRAGIALVPEDRRAQGLVLQHSIKDNLMLPVLRRFEHWLLINDRKGARVVQQMRQQLTIVTDSIFKLVGLLSGGNQQKVVIAKWLAAEAQILLMDEPTAGVDIRVKAQIVGIVRELAARGKAVIVVSSELPELLAVSDRILVLRGGSVRRVIDRNEIVPAQGDGPRVADEEEALHRVLQEA